MNQGSESPDLLPEHGSDLRRHDTVGLTNGNCLGQYSSPKSVLVFKKKNNNVHHPLIVFLLLFMIIVGSASYIFLKIPMDEGGGYKYQDQVDQRIFNIWEDDGNLYFSYIPDDQEFFNGTGDFTNVLKIYLSVNGLPGYRIMGINATHRITISFYNNRIIDSVGQRFNGESVDVRGWDHYTMFNVNFNRIKYVGMANLFSMGVNELESISGFYMIETKVERSFGDYLLVDVT